jgi:hypothetical protein
MAPVASLIFHPPEVFDASAARKKGPRSWLGDCGFSGISIGCQVKVAAVPSSRNVVF